MLSYIEKLREEINPDTEKVGGKSFPLFKLLNKFNISKGFVITTDIYDYYVKNNKLPDNLYEEIEEVIKEENIKFPLIARSSATIEDTYYHSFAGQFISIFPINNINELLESIIKIYQSVNSEKVRKYIELLDVKKEIKMAVLVQEFIQTDYGGVSFSKNIFKNNDDVVIEVGKGLTENVVSGKALSNLYFVKRNNLDLEKIIYRFDIDDNLIKEIAKNVIEIENLFGYPVDVEFGIKDNKIYIFQVRPISIKRRISIDFEVPKDWGYIEGVPTGTGKVFGTVRIVKNKKDLNKLKPGEILVSYTTYNNWMPDMLKASGIINEIGNITSHASIVAKEFGIPTVVNVKDATKILKDGYPVFIDADEGKVYYPGKDKIKLYDFTSDYILDLTPLNIKTLEKVSLLDVIKSPKEIVLYEEYMGYKILYFHPKIDEKIKNEILNKYNAIEGNPDVHLYFIEVAYGLLIHKGLKEWIEKGKDLLNNLDIEGLDKYFYESIKKARRKMREAFEYYKRIKENGEINDYLRIMGLVDESYRYFDIPNWLFPMGYGIRKLRELASKYGDYRLVLARIEDYKDKDVYELYKILEKWKNKSDELDVWDERIYLWKKVRNTIKKKFGFDINDYIEDGSGYKLDKYLEERFGTKVIYLI
ncbi:MAG: PEP/pyruvate-binding domain-containing protein [Nanopusillaceae archaeon]